MFTDIDVVMGVSDFLVSPKERRAAATRIDASTTHTQRKLAGTSAPDVRRVRGGASDAVIEMALFCPVRVVLCLHCMCMMPIVRLAVRCLVLCFFVWVHAFVLVCVGWGGWGGGGRVGCALRFWCVACGMWHVVCGMWHVVCGVWCVVCGAHVVCGVWGVGWCIMRGGCSSHGASAGVLCAPFLLPPRSVSDF